MLGEGYFIFYHEDFESAFYDPSGNALTDLGKYDHRIDAGHFSNGLVGLRYFNEKMKRYELGFLNKKGEWQIKLGTIECPQGNIDPIPQASKGFIKVQVDRKIYFYDHYGTLLNEFDYNDENSDWDRFSILQPIPKAWPRD